MHCKLIDGYASWRKTLRAGSSHRRFAGQGQRSAQSDSPSGALRSLRRNTALHIASWNGHTETALALVGAGADVHCKNNYGYGLWLAALGAAVHARVFGASQCGANGRLSRMELQGCFWALQSDSAAPSVSEWPHRDGGGAGRGGRRRALQGQIWVRPCIHCSVFSAHFVHEVCPWIAFRSFTGDYGSVCQRAFV